jgi:hypothetical protein
VCPRCVRYLVRRALTDGGQSDFFRSLTTNLRTLRELDAEKRMFRVAAGEDMNSDDEDDEYVQQKAPRPKKRRTTA